jgi:hypothetical protein
MNEITTLTQAPAATMETASTAAASQAKALVEARYVMALRRPRNWDQVRQDLMKECRRPGFAHNKSAWYKKPIGSGVEGLGIRFVELALRCMTNVTVETSMVFEDDLKEIHRVIVTDLESNFPLSQDVKVVKTVERSKPNDDGSYISVRVNSYGKNVYTVTATEDDLLNKRGALISKVIRTLGLRLIPGDLQDEAEAVIKRVRHDAAAQDPDAERKRILDAFSGIGVTAVNLAAYLGHDIAQCSPAQLVDLRGLYGAIKDGETTWRAVMENKAEADGGEAEPEKPAPQRGPRAKSKEQQPPEQQANAPAPAPQESAEAGSAEKVNAGQAKYIESKLTAVGIDVTVILGRYGIASLADMNVLQFDELRAELVAAS